MDTIVAAVIGALATISAALLPMAWPTIANATKRRFSRRPENVAELHRVEVFQVRNSSDAKMTEDVAEGSRVRFFGVSQKNLTIYLESIFSRLEAKERSLEEIDVLFASELDGQLWEGPEFRTLVMSARHAAAELFTSEEWSTSPAKKLAFFQSTHHMSYGGCLIEVPDGRQVAYVANYLPSAAPNAKDSLTFRFEDSVWK